MLFAYVHNDIIFKYILHLWQMVRLWGPRTLGVMGCRLQLRSASHSQQGIHRHHRPLILRRPSSDVGCLKCLNMFEWHLWIALQNWNAHFNIICTASTAHRILAKWRCEEKHIFSFLRNGTANGWYTYINGMKLAKSTWSFLMPAATDLNSWVFSLRLNTFNFSPRSLRFCGCTWQP